MRVAQTCRKPALDQPNSSHTAPTAQAAIQFPGLLMGDSTAWPAYSVIYRFIQGAHH
jgi:hypothetical protein